MDPMVIALVIALVGLAIAVPLELAALARLRRFRLIGGTLFFGAGALVLFVAVAGAFLVLNLATYARLTHEQQAARITLRQLGERRFVATLQAPKEAARHYELAGDE